jgi:arylsulfatase A-like enzyme
LNIDGQKTKIQGYITDILTELAIQWLTQERDPEKPFFLFLSHKAVHAMFEPAERHRGRYENKPLQYPSTMSNDEVNYIHRPQWVRAQRNSWHGVDYMYHGQMDFDTFYRRYCETLLALDESIGQMRQTLATLALDRETCLMYMGDNGFCFGEHGLIDKRHMYEESMRIPFLVCCPSLIEPGSVIQELVQNIDVAPTILHLAGIKKPPSMDGHSLLDLLLGKSVDNWRDHLFYEYYWERNFPQTPTTFGVRSKQWKYIHYHGLWDVDELYDLQNDPEEKYNLIDQPEFEPIQSELNRKMWDWLESTDGMKIPLRRDQGFRADQRRPQ